MRVAAAFAGAVFGLIAIGGAVFIADPVTAGAHVLGGSVAAGLGTSYLLGRFVAALDAPVDWNPDP